VLDVGSEAYAKECREWQRQLYDGGWAGLTWPTAFGGRGASVMESLIFNKEQARYSVPIGHFTVATAMVGPTLIAHGRDDQRSAHLPAILRGDQVWCQLFSEPGAGSDLASLQTKAERDGDDFVINGQKVWTSFAQYSDWAILLARTGEPGSGRAGITYFLCDMTTPGVEVRPLRQMTGVAHFNEVFLTDVRIPSANVVGEVDGGWTVARTTLGSERAAIGGNAHGRAMVEALIELAQRHDRNGELVARQELSRAFINARLLEFLGFRLQTALSHGRMPGPEASVLKLLMSRQFELVGDLGVQLEGPWGTLRRGADDRGTWQRRLCDQFAVRIGGGTDEVQRNIVAERVLGLPRELQPT
jgi:alkylation response protein AidB-like acyl-CoA dehydrogenase